MTCPSCNGTGYCPYPMKRENKHLCHLCLGSGIIPGRPLSPDPRNMLRPGSEEEKIVEASNETDAGGMWKKVKEAIKWMFTQS